MNRMNSRGVWLLSTMLLLAACGGGGGDRAPGVEPGPAPPGSGAPPDPLPPDDPTTISVTDISSDAVVTVQVEEISMASPPTVTFQLVVDGRRVSGLGSSNVRWSLAQLVSATDYDIDNWSSYIAVTEDPVCRTAADVNSTSNACTTFTSAQDPAQIEDSALKVQDPAAIGRLPGAQATTENSGTLIDNEDGSWSYTFSTDPGDPAGLTNMHRACLQLSLNAPAANACVDFVPADLVDPAIGLDATSLHPGFYDVYRSRQLVAEASCNSCHDQLALHGGGRTATDYCVSCHNPGTIDANSSNTQDFKVLVHRIHYARNLDSVENGSPYIIWGFRNGEHDFSDVSYPQDVRNCTRCHAGSQDVDYALQEGLPPPEAVLTPDGHNWASKPSPDACLSCHESAADHAAEHDTCVNCHGPGEFASIQEKHRDLLQEQGRQLALDVSTVTRTGAGEYPLITFTATRDGAPLDILDADEFTGDIRFRIGWDAASEYLNSGGGSTPISITAAAATPIGSNVFALDTTGTTPIPADIDTLGVQGAIDETSVDGSAHGQSSDNYFASSAASPTARRIVVTDALCNNCHQRLTYHAPGSRSVTNNVQACVACHGPNRRSSSQGNSTDFTVAIHGLHASGFRQTPYRSWDEARIQFPGNLADCATCHTGDTYQLPLPVQRVPLRDATSDLYTTPIAAACGACHDGSLAAAHMESAGGAVFNGDLSAASAAVESCEVCHRSGASADIDLVHAR